MRIICQKALLCLILYLHFASKSCFCLSTTIHTASSRFLLNSACPSDVGLNCVRACKNACASKFSLAFDAPGGKSCRQQGNESGIMNFKAMRLVRGRGLHPWPRFAPRNDTPPIKSEVELDSDLMAFGFKSQRKFTKLKFGR